MSLHYTWRSTFSSLRIANYRKYFLGQSTSLIGTWMQAVAQSWLVLQLTHSATDIGIVVALQTLPTLILGPYAGVVADRVDKRKLLMVLQGLMGVQAAVLSLMTFQHDASFAVLSLLALILGINNCFENPVRQSFILEMVGAAELRNAVSLNSTMVNVARAIGPAVAGVMIASVGEAWCFALNALSFVAVVLSLVTMDVAALSPAPPTPRAKGQMRQGLTYVAQSPQLYVPLCMMGLVGSLAYEFQVSLPSMVQTVYHGRSLAYGEMTSAMGLGAVVGGLVTAQRGRTGTSALVRTSAMFGLTMALAALMPDIYLDYGAMALVGYYSVAFISSGNSTLQLAFAPEMRGRVMALWAVAFLGSTPIGGPLIGWIIEQSSPRVGLGVGAFSCVVAALIAQWTMRRRDEVVL